MLVLAVAFSAVTASAAQAAPVWVWACQTPLEIEKTPLAATTGGCVGANPALQVTAPAGGTAKLTFRVPAGTRATSIKVSRSGAATGTYALTTDTGQTLETSTAAADPTFTANATSITFTVGDGAALDVTGVGFFVDDTEGPTGVGVNWNSPVDKVMELKVTGTDAAAGLDRAEVTIAEAPALTTSAPFGTCPKPPEAAEPDPHCALILVDVRGLNPGSYHRTVRVYDKVGNSVIGLDNNPFEVWHPVLGSPTQTLSIGSSGVDEPQTNPNPGPRPNPNPGTPNAACRTPRLSVSLDQKPLRVRRGVIYLQYKKRYRFAGRLTCVVNGKRRSAPKRTKVEILNEVGKRTASKPAAQIGASGRLKVSLRYPLGARTIIFRYRNADGQRSQVSIKIKVERKKTSKR